VSFLLYYLCFSAGAAFGVLLMCMLFIARGRDGHDDDEDLIVTAIRSEGQPMIWATHRPPWYKVRWYQLLRVLTLRPPAD
jgi:hypothetical protein